MNKKLDELKPKLRQICVDTASEYERLNGKSFLTCQNLESLTELAKNPVKFTDKFEKQIKKSTKKYVDGIENNISKKINNELSSMCINLNKLSQKHIPFLGGQVKINIPQKCPSSNMNLELTFTKFPLSSIKEFKVKSGVTVSTEGLKNIFKDGELNANLLDKAIDIKWDKITFEPSLETIIKKEFDVNGKYFTLNGITHISDGLNIATTMRSPSYPLNIPINLSIDKKGFHLKPGDIKGYIVSNICSEINDYFIAERLELFSDARILGAPTGYCVSRNLRGLNFIVEVKFPSPLNKQDINAYIDIERGLRIELPDTKQLLASSALDALGVNYLKPVAPYYSYDDSLTLFFDGTIKTPLDLDLEFGFRVSPRKFNFTGPIELIMSKWIDSPSGVSVGKGGIGFNPRNKRISLRGSVALAPGKVTNKLFRVDGLATMGIKDGTIVLKGSLKFLSILDLMTSITTISPKDKLFKTEISSSPLLVDGIDINGLLRIQVKDPYPYLSVNGKGTLLGADIAQMQVRLNNDFSGHFKSKLNIPLAKNGVKFDVNAKKHLKNLSATGHLDLQLKPFKFHLDMMANEHSTRTSIEMKPPKLSLSVGIPFYSLTPSYLLSLIKDIKLSLDLPSKIDFSHIDNEKSNSGSDKRIDKDSSNNTTEEKIIPQPKKYTLSDKTVLQPLPTWWDEQKQDCKPKKIEFGFKISWGIDCGNPYIIPHFVTSRYSHMSNFINKSIANIRTKKYYYSEYGCYEFFIENPDTKGGKLYVFHENGNKIWHGNYKGKGTAIKTKVITSISNILVTKKESKVYIVPEGENYQDQKKEIDNGYEYSDDNDSFGKILLQAIAFQLVNKNQEVNIVKTFSKANNKSWALLKTSSIIKENHKYTLVNYNAKRTPEVISFDIIPSKGKINEKLMMIALTDNINSLKNLFSDACKHKESHIMSTCGYLMVNTDKKWVFGLEDKESKEEAYHGYWSYGEYAEEGNVTIRNEYREEDSFTINQLTKLTGEPMSKLLSHVMEGVKGNKLKIKSATFNYGPNQKRMALYGIKDDNASIAIVTEDIKNSDAKPFIYKIKKLSEMKNYFKKRDTGILYSPSKEEIENSRLSEEEIWLHALTWPKEFEELGFKSNPINGFYSKDRTN